VTVVPEGHPRSRSQSFVLWLVVASSVAALVAFCVSSAGGPPPLTDPYDAVFGLQIGAASASPPPEPAAAATPVGQRRLWAVVDESRRTTDRAPTLTRMRGRVLRSGQPVASCDLSFYPATEAWRERAVDWCLSDGDGHYEVQLPADVYVVQCQDAATWTATVRVMPIDRELLVDFELPR